LAEIGQQYSDGADPMAILRDLAEITHWVSVVKITPDAAEDPTVSPDERMRGRTMADALPMRVLTRMWQMLLKALDEVATAPNAMMAAEMAVIRLTHVADLPTPEELVRKLNDMPTPPPAGPGGGGSRPAQTHSPQSPASHTSHGTHGMSNHTSGGTTMHGSGNTVLAVAGDAALSYYASFDHVIDLIRSQRDVKLLVEVETTLRLAAYQPGRIEFEPTHAAAPDLAQRLGSRLQSWTGKRWVVSIVAQGGAETIAEKRDAAELALRAKAQEHPLVQAVLGAFPKAEITKIKTIQDITASAQADALPEVEDEWDPFEEE